MNCPVVAYRAGLALIATTAVLPLVPLLIWSVARQWYFPRLVPMSWSLRAWGYVATPSAKILPALGWSAAIAFTVAGLSLLAAVPAGRALGLARFRGKTFVEFLILAPIIVPSLASVMGIHVLFIRYGLADTVLGVVLVHLIATVPYATLIMAGAFANFDVDFEDQARTLGATAPQRVRWVTLPLVLPSLVVAFLFAFLISWNQYVLTLLIGGGQVITLPLVLFTAATGGDYPVTAALALVFVAPAILVLLVSARHLRGSGGVQALGKL